MNSNVEKDKQRRSNLLLNLYKNNKFSEAIDYSVSFMKDFPTNASGYNIYALSFRYGQRHEFEIGAAKQCAQLYQVKDHIVLDIDLRAFGGSALTDNIDVPKNRKNVKGESEIPITYVPARNTIFL